MFSSPRTLSHCLILQLTFVMIVILLMSNFLKMANAQEDDTGGGGGGGEVESPDWPVISDPFPESSELGEEPEPPPAADCSAVCQEKIDGLNTQITTLQQQLTDANTALSDRVTTLESSGGGEGGGGGSGNGDSGLAQRVSTLETQQTTDRTDLTTKIDTDIDALRTQLSGDIATTKSDLETRIAGLGSGGGGGGGSGDGGASATYVYSNLTQRIDGLENGKIQTLIVDNDLWRKNFRVVNATFAKLKKSNFGNNVVLTG